MLVERMIFPSIEANTQGMRHHLTVPMSSSALRHSEHSPLPFFLGGVPLSDGAIIWPLGIRCRMVSSAKYLASSDS